MQDLISLPRSIVEQMCRFYSKCLDAERFFEACQAPSYQRFISGNVTHAETRAAFEETQKRLTLAESQRHKGDEEKTEPETRRTVEKAGTARRSSAGLDSKENTKEKKVKYDRPDPGIIPVIPSVADGIKAG